MILKLGDRVRAPGRLLRRREFRGRHEWYKPLWMHAGVEGVFVGVRTYVNGTVSGGFNADDPLVFKGNEWIKVALICSDPRKKPVAVLYDECEVILTAPGGGAAMSKEPRIIPDGAHHSGLMKDYGGRYNPAYVDEKTRLRRALEFYARHEHWMALGEGTNNDQKLLIANGDTTDTNGWAVAEKALSE